MRTRLVPILVALALAVSGCGGDDDDSGLSAAERDWCSFSAEGGIDEDRWVQIFDAGRLLGLNMLEVNGDASDLRLEFEAEGMGPDEAVAATSEALFENENFVAACREAYRLANG